MTSSRLRPSHYLDDPNQSWRTLSLDQSRKDPDPREAPAAEVPEEALGLAADIDYEVQDGLLRIRVAGPLDARCTSRLLAIGRAVDDSISACRLSLGGVTRVLDSGIAALKLLARALTRKGVGIRLEGLDLDQATPSHYQSTHLWGAEPASTRRVFTWSAPSLFDADPLVMPIKIPSPRPNKA